MAIISTVLGNIDTAVEAIGSDVYNSMAGAAYGVAKPLAVLAVVMTGINIMIQAVPISVANGVSLMFRIGVVFVFLTGAGSYSNFNTVFSAITDAPADYGAYALSSFSGGVVTDLNNGLDKLYLQAVDTGQNVMDNGGYFIGPLVGVVFWCIAALMAVFTIMVVGASKIVVAAMILIGPIAIACTLAKTTAPFFEAWVKLTFGFALVPLLAAIMAGVVLYIAKENIPSDLSTAENIGDLVNFIVVMVLGCGLMLMVPSMASSLSATGIGLMAVAASTVALGRGAMSVDRKGQEFVGKGYDWVKHGGASRAAGAVGSAASSTASGAKMAAGTAISLARKMSGR